MALAVMGILETRDGLEVIVQGKSRTMIATIPQEVSEPLAEQFKAKMVDKDTLQIVYNNGSERRVYETQIKS